MLRPLGSFSHLTRLETVRTAIGISLEETKGVSLSYVRNNFLDWAQKNKNSLKRL